MNVRLTPLKCRAGDEMFVVPGVVVFWIKAGLSNSLRLLLKDIEICKISHRTPVNPSMQLQTYPSRLEWDSIHNPAFKHGESRFRVPHVLHRTIPIISEIC